jgi:hypothetical protein
MGKVLEFPTGQHGAAALAPPGTQRPVHLPPEPHDPPGHPLHGQRTITLTDARVLLDPALLQPAASRLYDLVAHHHNRQPRDWITLGQLTAELAARSLDWPQIGLDPVGSATG